MLVIGATNAAADIAPKVLARFERRILVDNPNSSARRALITRQLAQEDGEHNLSASDMHNIIERAAGRSAVNIERLVSTAVLRAVGAPVSRASFDQAFLEEPSDFDVKVARINQKYDNEHGWHAAA